MPEDCDTKRRSTLSIRLFLKEFCIEFLNAAYNKIMYIVKVGCSIRKENHSLHFQCLFLQDYLNRKKAQQNDETYYLWAIKFFMEFNRVHKFRYDFIPKKLKNFSLLSSKFWN